MNGDGLKVSGKPPLSDEIMSVSKEPLVGGELAGRNVSKKPITKEKWSLGQIFSRFFGKAEKPKGVEVHLTALPKTTKPGFFTSIMECFRRAISRNSSPVNRESNPKIPEKIPTKEPPSRFTPTTRNGGFDAIPLPESSNALENSKLEGQALVNEIQKGRVEDKEKVAIQKAYQEQSITQLFDTKDGFKAIEAFCLIQFNTENLKLFSSIKDYQAACKTEGTNNEKLQAMHDEIVNKFIKKDSEYWLNLSDMDTASCSAPFPQNQEERLHKFDSALKTVTSNFWAEFSNSGPSFALREKYGIKNN